MDDFCFAVDGDQAARDVERDGGSFLAADLDGCAGVMTTAIELVVHLVHPAGAVALNETGAVNRSRSQFVFEIVRDGDPSEADVTGAAANGCRPNAACLAHALGFSRPPPLPV